MKPLFEPTDAVLNAVAPVTNLDSLPAMRTAQISSRSNLTRIVSDDEIDALGVPASSGLSGLSQKLLATIRASDADVFGAQLNTLVTTAKGLNPDKLKSGVLARFSNLFGSAKETMLAQYATVESRMGAIIGELSRHETLHKGRIADFDTMYNDNYIYHQGLEAAVTQGRDDLLVALNHELEREHTATDAFAAQRLADVKYRRDRLEKRTDDLSRAMVLSKQMAPQIRLSQDNARALTTVYADVIAVSIPAWRNVFSLYLLQMEAKQSAAVANAAYDATDAAFRAQADMLLQNTENIAKVKQRSVVSTDTLEHVQKQLITSFDALDRIAEEGRAARKAAEPKLFQLEQELITRFIPKKTERN